MSDSEDAPKGGQSEQWLRLTDYASKYRISISTLRRRIKHAQLAYRFEDGKYLIVDEAPSFSDSVPASTPADAQVTSSVLSEVATASTSAALQAAPLIQQAQERLDQLRLDQLRGVDSNLQNHDEPILSSASRLLTELKRAYTNILQEKEEQIIQLKEEVSDLKTLVRVLEDDNERMRRILKSPSSYASI
jgi:hypothetical protein